MLKKLILSSVAAVAVLGLSHLVHAGETAPQDAKPRDRIVTSPSDGLVEFCRSYSHDYSNKCLRDTFKDNGPKTATAACVAKTFADFNGDRFQFLRKNPIEFDIFKQLCPAVVDRGGR